jgi:hypothetical protein
MKPRFKYEVPVLVNLSAESVVGDSCSTGNFVDFYCHDGSCAAWTQCYTGGSAQACTTGNGAGSDTTNTNCLGCCQTGSSPKTAYPCWCNPGYGAAWQCDYGGNDSIGCGGGGNYPNCP